MPANECLIKDPIMTLYQVINSLERAGNNFDLEYLGDVESFVLGHDENRNIFSGVPVGTFLCIFLEYDFSQIDNINLFIDFLGMRSIERTVPIENSDIAIPIKWIKLIHDSQRRELMPLLQEQALKLAQYINDDIPKRLQPLLIESQQLIKKTIDYCINIYDFDYLNNLSFIERFFVGAFSYNGPLSEMIDRLEDLPSPSIFPEEKAYTIRNIAWREKWPPEILARHIEESEIEFEHYIERYPITDIRMAPFFEFRRLLQLGKMPIKKCMNCGNYFIPASRSDEIYCDKITNGKSCKEVGYLNKLKYDSGMVADREYRKTYKTKNAQKQRLITGKSNTFIKRVEDDFSIWTDQAKEKLKAVKNGEMEIDTFLSWLKNDWRGK